MNKFKLFFMGLMTLILGTLTSCVPSSDDDGTTTAYMTGFFEVSQNGKVLTADDGHNFSVSNPSYLQFKDGTTPARVAAQLKIVIPKGKTIEDVYKTEYYEVSIMDAYVCIKGIFLNDIDPKEAPAETTRFERFQPSAADGYLNCMIETIMSEKAAASDFIAYAEKVVDNTLYITVRNISDATKGTRYSAAISFPIGSVLEAYKSKGELEPIASKTGTSEFKYYKLNVNGNEVQYLTK